MTILFVFSESGGNVTNSFSDSITNQLLDLTIDTNQTTDHTVNFNNNSLITSAPLVTSDSHETKGISSTSYFLFIRFL